MNDILKRFEKESGLTLDMFVTLNLLDEAGAFAKISPESRNKQSTYSRQISRLEKFLGGIKLTTRSGNKIALSKTGKELAEQVRLHFKKIQDIVENNSDQGAEFHIGANGTVLEWFVIPRLIELAKKEPKLSFRFSDMRTDDVAEALRESRIDFGILRSNHLLGTAFKTSQVAAHGYKLYGPAGMGASEMLKLPMALASSREFRTEIESRAAAKKVPLHVNFECQSHSQCARLVKGGATVAILPDLADEEMCGYAGESLAWLKPYKRKMALAWEKKSANGSKSRLAQLVIKALTQN